MLSGDYSKLNLFTPKIYEYLKLPKKERSRCIAEVLSNAGYRTAFLQASDLSYMSKDQFMPAAGFDTVSGSEYFTYSHVPFGWGPDDKAFLEQAFFFIEDFYRKDDPWFISLLTVGTHHPYAVTDKFAQKYPSRKTAAVAYLDEALDTFYQNLKTSGILEDTLVLFVCDESHGVTGHPYGRYWGLAVAHAPESKGTINPGVYGLIHVPYSILDYLGIANKRDPFQEISFFRKPAGDRTILYENGMSRKKGVMIQKIDSNMVTVIRPSNGQMFSSNYTEEQIHGSEGEKLASVVEQAHHAANNSLMDSNRKEREYVLIRNDSYNLNSGEENVLTTGQYLDIPADSTATVKLKAYVGTDTAGMEPLAELKLIMIHWYEKMEIPEIELPSLSAGETLDLSFEFSTTKSLYRVWAYLRADSLIEDGTCTVSIQDFSIDIKPATHRPDSTDSPLYGFQIHHRTVE
jgi:hypothetical protein